jgi:hypothetical protein
LLSVQVTWWIGMHKGLEGRILHPQFILRVLADRDEIWSLEITGQSYYINNLLTEILYHKNLKKENYYKWNCDHFNL